jgi:type II secretory pathway pseudopilin PulG
MAPSFLKVKAFSLTELLIALGLVGTLAALTVPGFLNDVQEAKRKTVLKEGVTSVQQLTYGYLSGHAKAGETFKDYVFRTAQAIQKCPYNTPTHSAIATVSATDATTCRTTVTNAGNPEPANMPTLLKADGSTQHWGFYDDRHAWVFLDWDGNKEATGWNGLVLVANAGPTGYFGPCLAANPSYGEALAPGQVESWCRLNLAPYNAVMGIPN